MPEKNKANRQVCDVVIRDYKTNAIVLDFETANTTTAGISSDTSYAMAKGTRKIAFDNPLEGTMTLEAQVYPFKLFSLFSDGVVASNGIVDERQTITATSAGVLTVNVTNGTVQAGSLFVTPASEIADGSNNIAGAFADGTFTATTASDIVVGEKYNVFYLVKKTTGVGIITFNNDKAGRDYRVSMFTVDKDEEGTLTPFIMIAHKATIQREFELEFSSEGDPASVTLTFNLMEDKNRDVMTFAEITSTNEDVMTVGSSAVTIKQGKAAADVSVIGAVGTVTAAVKDSSDAAYAKVHAQISGDNDTVIIYADADAVAGTYTVTLTDSKATPQTAVIGVTVEAAE